MTAQTWLAEERDPFCLSPTSAAGLLAEAPWQRFACIGDSLAAGTGGPSPGYAHRGWADRVADVLRRLQPDLAYLNTGVLGATTETTLEQVGPALAFAPDLLTIACGANDIWRRQPDLARTERALGRLFALASGSGAQLTTFTLGSAFVVAGYADWHDRVCAVNDVIRRVAAEHGAVLVDMWKHPVNTRPDLLSADGIHFSASGQAVMASEVVRGLSRVLEGRAA